MYNPLLKLKRGIFCLKKTTNSMSKTRCSSNGLVGKDLSELKEPDGTYKFCKRHNFWAVVETPILECASEVQLSLA